MGPDDVAGRADMRLGLQEGLRRLAARVDESIGQLGLSFPTSAVPANAVADGLRAALGSPPDFVTRQFADAGGRRVAVAYLETLVGAGPLERELLTPLVEVMRRVPACDLEALERALLPTRTSARVSSLEQVVELLLQGHAAVCMEGQSGALAVNLRSAPQRSVEQPTTETVTRGPHDGFTEDLKTNLGLLRTHLRSGRLRMERFDVGRVASTEVVLAYLDGIARVDLCQEVRNRLADVDLDAVLDSGYIEELIEDNPLSVLPSVASTERPDRVAANLLDGCAAVFVAGSPFVLLVPGRVETMLQSPEDYYVRYPIAAFTRAIRWFALVITSTLTALYVAVTTFHPQLLPSPIFLSFAAAREGVPLPPWLEGLLMEGAFELVREAGLRMPRTVGQTVSIVGVLVVGQAAVMAHVVSPVIIVIVGTTAIAAFAIPNVDMANGVRILRFPAILLAATFGLYGLTLGVLYVAAEMLDRDSFGEPFLTRGFVSFDFQLWKDTWIRAPWWLMWRRAPQVRQAAVWRRPPGRLPER